MGAWEDASELAVLASGAYPEWERQVQYTGAPASASSGKSLNGALQTLVAVLLRGEVHHRRAWVTITTLDLSASDYTVTIDGNAVTYDADSDTPAAADEEDVIEGIAEAINADGTVNQIVTATAIDTDDDDVLDTVLIEGIGEDDFSIAVSATGSAVMACAADPLTASLRAWGKAGGTGGSSNKPDGWTMVRDAEGIAVTSMGWIERLETAGLARLYVEIYELAGHVDDGGTVTYEAAVHIGPAGLRGGS